MAAYTLKRDEHVRVDVLAHRMGERVQLLLRFRDYAGLFVYHCHMLEHGDTGLMRNYLVRA